MHAGDLPYWIHGIGLHGAGGWLAALIAAWLVLAEPLLGRRAFRGFLRALERGDRAARVRFYRLWSVQSWVLMALLLLIALYGFGWTPAQLGLRMPHAGVRIPSGFLLGFMLALFAGGLLGAVLARRRRHPATAERGNARDRRGSTELARMLPRSGTERRWFAVLAITAGITEEVVWRGVLLAITLAFLPGLPMVAQVLVLAVVFGWAHLYQGVRGMLGTGILGVVLAALYLATGSLLVPVLVHALIDLAAMLQVPRAPADDVSGPGGT